MEEITDFESFYESKLQPFLKDLNLQSNEASKWSTAGIASVILSVACFIINEQAVGFLFIIVIVISIYKYIQKKDDLTYTYKRTIIKEIINYLNPGAEYSPSKRISSKDYKKSGLFTHVFNYYGGEDFIKGVYKNVTFYSSELNTGHKTQSGNDNNVSIFHGLFFAAPLSSLFTANTYIWPYHDKQLPHSLADEYFERFMPLPKLYHIKTTNPDFDKHFWLYTTTPSEANEIVDAQMMERMIHFKRQINRDVRFSFVSGVCYVAIGVKEDLLEPSVSDPGNKENIKEYFFSVLLILSIINQLNLSQLV